MVRGFERGLVDSDGTLKKGTGMSGVTEISMAPVAPVALVTPVKTIERHFGDGIPVLTARGKSLALAWENALLELWQHGCHIETQYDQAGDLPSVDATMMIVVEYPMSEPAIHRCFPGGPADLEEYRMEVVEGVKDHWVKNPGEPGYSGEWSYTYHGRMRKYDTGPDRSIGIVSNGEPLIEQPGVVDQIEQMIAALAKAPHTRRAQCVTWQVWRDPGVEDPPCWQSFWCRVSQGPDGELVLNANIRFRSRDGYGAAFMNLWAEVAMMEMVAAELTKRIGKPVYIGRLCDLSDSFHIYGRNIAEFKERFLGLTAKRSIEDRTWTREFAQPFFDEARPAIIEKIRRKDAGLRPEQE
jgi:thymidylate synthase